MVAALDFRGRWTGIDAAGNVWAISGNPYWVASGVVAPMFARLEGETKPGPE